MFVYFFGFYCGGAEIKDTDTDTDNWLVADVNKRLKFFSGEVKLINLPIMFWVIYSFLCLSNRNYKRSSVDFQNWS